MNPQEFQQFLQDYPELIPYIQEDPELLREVVLNRQVREDAIMQVTGKPMTQPQGQVNPAMVTQDQFGRKTQDGYATSTNDGGWDFSNNKNMYDPKSLDITGGEAGTTGRNEAVDRVYGKEEATEYSWKPSFKVNSPSGMSYIMGEEQAKQAFKNMVDGGYARPQDFEKLVQPTGNTMKSYDLANTNIGIANNQNHFQYRNEQFAKDPDAEMMRRATNMDDIRRNNEYKSTGTMQDPDTYTRESWDAITSQKQKENDNINAFATANAPTNYTQPAQHEYKNYDASGGFMGNTYGVSGKSNAMLGASSVTAQNGKSYQTNQKPLEVKTQPKINIPTNLNNIKSNVSKQITSAVKTNGTGQVSKTPLKAPTPNKPMLDAKKISASQSPLQQKVINTATTIKDKLLSSLRKGK